MARPSSVQISISKNLRRGKTTIGEMQTPPYRYIGQTSNVLIVYGFDELVLGLGIPLAVVDTVSIFMYISNISFLTFFWTW